MKKNNEELKQLSSDELRKKMNELRSEHFRLKMNLKTTQIKDYSQLKKLRKNIARIMTRLNM